MARFARKGIKPDEEAPPRSRTRDRIVAAGFELFLKHGFDGTGLSRILATTGLSKGAFYHYFDSKEALYREVVERFFSKQIRAFDFDAFDRQQLKDSRAVLTDAYGQLPGAVKAAGIDMARYFALFFEAFSRLEDFREETRAYYQDILKSLARRGYEQREILPRTAENHAVNVIASLEGRLFLEAIFGAGGIGPLLEREEIAERQD